MANGAKISHNRSSYYFAKLCLDKSRLNAEKNDQPNGKQMTTNLVSIRVASEHDAPQIAEIHETAWRLSYQGLLPHIALEQSIARRGPGWWQKSLQQRPNTLVLELDGELGGYSTIGRNRTPSLPFTGEILELYMKPTYQGLGFGRRLFESSRQTLESRNLSQLVVWSLRDNYSACKFYERMGGRRIAEQYECFGSTRFRKIAYGWK